MSIIKIKLNIEGMHCGACAVGIQMLLENTEGVKKAAVDYNSKIGEVEFDDEKIKLENIIKAIEELGYKASPGAGN